MGAIAGFYGQIVSKQELMKVTDTLHRRSPGGWESLEVPRGLLITGKGQEEVLKPWDQRLWDSGEEYLLCFSGKLDNRKALFEELSALGHGFRGESDREVVLHAFAHWGRDCFIRLHGRYSFAIFEQRAQRLTLVRDKLGISSLFYRFTGGHLQFGSEIKTVLAFPGVRARLTKEGAAQLLLFSPGRIPGSGIFEDIRELEPGCCAVFCGEKQELVRYWRLQDGEHREDLPQTAEHIRALLTDSVAGKTAGHSCFGTLLSGGLDSSILTAICAGSQPGKELQTFSVDYRNNRRNFVPGKFQPDSDESYIDQMVETFSCRHRRTVLTPEDLCDRLQQAAQARDLPGMGDVDSSLMAFSEQVKNFVPMVLSGECADEIFGGYPWFRDPEIRMQSGFPWAQNTSARAALLNFSFPQAEEMVMDACSDTCRSADILPGTSKEERRIKELTVLNLRWFMQTLLERNDRMTAACGLDVRVPFCDDRIAQYLYTVPWEMKNLEGREKGLLRYAVKGLLPERIRLRKKSPYPKTFDPQYEKMLESLLAPLWQEDRSLWYLLRRSGAEQLLESSEATPFYGQLMRRPQIMAWLWQTDWWLTHYMVDFCF